MKVFLSQQMTAKLSMLLRVALNASETGKANVADEGEGGMYIYNLDLLSIFTKTRWLNPALDSGPFVLMHGDFGMFNLITNDDLDILAVLDSEWTRVVPRQFFLPPTWITGRQVFTLS